MRVSSGYSYWVRFVLLFSILFPQFSGAVVDKEIPHGGAVDICPRPTSESISGQSIEKTLQDVTHAMIKLNRSESQFLKERRKFLLSQNYNRFYSESSQNKFLALKAMENLKFLDIAGQHHLIKNLRQVNYQDFKSFFTDIGTAECRSDQ